MTDKDEVMDPLRILRKRLQELANNLHIELNNVAFMIGQDPGDPDVAQVVFVLTPEALKTAEELESKRINDEFEKMMAGEVFIDKAHEKAEDEPLDLWDD